MVRLITHNLLTCHAKGCSTNNFPLKLTNVKLALREADINPDFLRGFLPRIEWEALIQASREVNQLVVFRSISKQAHVMLLYLNEIGDTSLPVERPDMLDDELLKQLHHVLLEVSRCIFCPFSLMTSFVDPRRRRFDDLSELRARLSHFEWDPKHGAHLPLSLPTWPVLSWHTPPRLQLLAEDEIG